MGQDMRITYISAVCILVKPLMYVFVHLFYVCILCVCILCVQFEVKTGIILVKWSFLCVNSDLCPYIQVLK